MGTARFMTIPPFSDAPQTSPYQDLEAWAAAVGLHGAGRLARIARPGEWSGPKWRDYHIESLGVEESAPEEAPDWPFFMFHGRTFYRVYACHITVRGIPGYIEWRFGADGQSHYIIVIPESPAVSEEKVATLLRARKLVVELYFKRQRPEGTGHYPTAQHFWDGFCDAWRELKPEYKRTKPPMKRIYEEMYLEHSQFYVLKQKFGLPDTCPDC
jgi:hypothetical protein